MLLLIAFGFLIGLFYIYLIKPLHYWRDKGVKQSKPWILFGDSGSTIFRMKSLGDWIVSIYNMYPKDRYAGFYQFSQPLLAIRDPELIKFITVRDFDHFTDHRSLVDPEFEILWTKNLFFLKGQMWKDMRVTLSGSYTSSKMKHMFCLIKEVSENFTQHFLNKGQDIIDVEMKDIFTRYTNDVIATTAFGIKVDSMEHQNNDFYVTGKNALDFNRPWAIIKFTGIMAFPKIVKFFKMKLFSKTHTDFFNNIVKETIKTRMEEGIVRPDMINILMDARKKNMKNVETIRENVIDSGYAVAHESLQHGKIAKSQKTITDDEIVSQAMLFFFAGFDNVSTLMCFLCYELAINQEIQQKLRAEIKNTFEVCNGHVTYETLLNMSYLDMVVSEAFRKWPTVLLVDRVCTKPYIITSTSSHETPLLLDKGDVVSIPIYAIHRDPEYYPDPDKFDPERFSDENKDNIKPYTYLPFGVGPRNCIGSRFALLEIKTVIFYILSHFQIIPNGKSVTPVRLSKKLISGNLAAEDGFWFTLKRIKD